MAINLSGLSLASDGAGGGGGVTSKMKFIPVTTLPSADKASKSAVYLVPAKNATAKNKYDEYVVLQTENGYIWELFGQDVSVDLQSFATKTDLNKKQDKLVNQQNIRSINGVPLVGAGNVNFAVFATETEHKKVMDFVNGAPETYATKKELDNAGGIKTVNGSTPDANGNLNLNVMTDEQKQIVDNATQQLTALVQKVGDFERDYGLYEELPDVALTPEKSGQYIDENGKYVTAEGWAVASIGEVTMGNKYELDMKSADNMVLGVAVFVSRVRVYNASGDVIKTTLTPLFSAKNTNVPKSGYLILNAYDTYTDVLVCYKPALTTSLKVLRYGDTASTATQLRNLRNAVDLKSFADGYYAGMRVGTADNLSARGEEYHVEFGGYRQAGGSVEIEEGTADVKSIKGNTIVWNQIVPNSNFSSENNPLNSMNTSIVNKEEDGSISVKMNSAQGNNGIAFYDPHIATNSKVLLLCEIKGPTNGGSIQYGFSGLPNGGYIYNGLTVDVDSEKFKFVGAVITKGTPSGMSTMEYIAVRHNSSMIGNTFFVKSFRVFNLTQMFGAGNEPATPEEFSERIGYSSVDEIPYFDYNEGELRNNDVKEIRCEYDGEVSVRALPTKKYFPEGLRSAGAAYDEMTSMKAITRVGVLDLGSLGYTSGARGVFQTEPIISIASRGGLKCAMYDYIGITLSAMDFSSKGDLKLAIGGTNTKCVYVTNDKYTTPNDFKAAMKGVLLYYELAEPIEEEYDELNLSYNVHPLGIESVTFNNSDGKPNVYKASHVYSIDAYNTIVSNRKRIEDLEQAIANIANNTNLQNVE